MQPQSDHANPAQMVPPSCFLGRFLQFRAEWSPLLATPNVMQIGNPVRLAFFATSSEISTKLKGCVWILHLDAKVYSSRIITNAACTFPRLYRRDEQAVWLILSLFFYFFLCVYHGQQRSGRYDPPGAGRGRKRRSA